MKQTKKDILQLVVRRFFLIVTDIILLNGSVLLALMMRFDATIQSIPLEYWERYKTFMIPYTIMALVVFWLCRIYHSLWEYASITELYKIVEACLITEVLHVTGTMLMELSLPRSCYFNAGVFLVVTVGASRFMYRMVRTGLQKYRQSNNQIRIMIIGAGEAANVLIREIVNSRYLDNSQVVCVIDDNPEKIGKYIHGIKIAGGRDKIKEVAEEYGVDEIIVAIPSASVQDKKMILNICKETDCELKILPGVYQMVGNEEISLKDLRKVDVVDLLGREPIEVDIDSIMGYVKDKVIMVTGGGGSIGSELCRQIAAHRPKLLIIFDIYENNAYDIQQELKRNNPDVNIKVLIGSVRNTNRMENIFAKYRPEIVYHAAAHKHVPLMEESPNEAIKNNVFGTLNVARMADKYGTHKFVLISTDKAVNPTNIMGASKRICEMIVQSFSEKSKTEFVAVRFGNVLGSNGSVIPLFKKQIESGGPVTVTHPDIIRYFMTIPEAVSLVLQAGAYAHGGEIFILDMGEPVKIDDLAKNLIRLSGYTLGVDMEIEYTGLRPGEKLFEELLMDEEGLQNTANKLIHIGKPIEIDAESFFEKLNDLKKSVYEETDEVRVLVKDIVSTYNPERRLLGFDGEDEG